MSCGFDREKGSRGAQIGRTLKNRQRGSSLVEQSFVIVFLLTMMLGIIDCGRALYTYHFVSNVARAASRWASVRSSTCKPGFTASPTRSCGLSARYSRPKGALAARM